MKSCNNYFENGSKKLQKQVLLTNYTLKNKLQIVLVLNNKIKVYVHVCPVKKIINSIISLIKYAALTISTTKEVHPHTLCSVVILWENSDKLCCKWGGEQVNNNRTVVTVSNEMLRNKTKQTRNFANLFSVTHSRKVSLTIILKGV